MLKCFVNISDQRFFAKYLFGGAFQVWAVSVTRSHCPILLSAWVPSTHWVNPSLTCMAGSHPRAWECSHSSKFPEKKSHLFTFVIKVNKRELRMNDPKRHSGEKTPQCSQHNTNVLYFWPALPAMEWCMMQQPSYSSRRGKPIVSESWIRKGNL